MNKLEDLKKLEKKSSVEIRYCEIIADEERDNRRARILKDGSRYFYHEMIDGEVTACFEIAESWRPFNFIVFDYTPDDRHIYRIESRYPAAKPEIMQLSDAQDGDSCAFRGHTVTLDGDCIIFDGKKIPVIEDHAYVFKLLKTKIRASGGAKGLYIWLEQIAEKWKNGIWPTFDGVFDLIAEKVNS